MELNKGDLLCPNCQEVYDEPCVLSCADSLCLSCIKKSKASEEAKEFECPLCKETVTGFKVQANLKRLVDQYKEELLKERHKCLTHVTTRLSLYCETCHQPICAECAKTTHADHQMIDINREQFAKYYTELMAIRGDLGEAFNMKSNQGVILKAEFKSIQEQYDSQMVEIDFVFKSIREFVESREAEIKRQLKSYHETNEELFQKNLEIIEEQSKSLHKTIEDIGSNDYIDLPVDSLFRDHKYFVVLQNYQASKLKDVIQSSKSLSLDHVRFRTADLRYHSQNTIQDRINKMIKLSQISVHNNRNTITGSNMSPSFSSMSLKNSPSTSSSKLSQVVGSHSDLKKKNSSDGSSGSSKRNSVSSQSSTGDISRTLTTQYSSGDLSKLTINYGFDEDDFSDEESTSYDSAGSANSSSTELVIGKGKPHPSFHEPLVQKVQIKNITLVYNPFSGSKIGEKIMNQAKKFFEENNVKVSVIPTEYKNHAEDICRTIDITNVDVVCMIGGDGTIHEAVNGVMKRDPESRSKFVLACLPAGTGNSFVLELQGKLNIKYVCKRILNGLTTPIDIARVTSLTKDRINQECHAQKQKYHNIQEKYGDFVGADKASLTQSQVVGTAFLEEHNKGIRPDIMMEFGNSQFTHAEEHTHAHEQETEEVFPEIIYSFNSLHWGLGSRINIRAEKLRWMGKAVRYTTAALLEMFKGEKILARVEYEEADGNKVAIEDEFCLGIINNIQGAAKGMKMAPKAKLNDGLIDLILIKSTKTIDLANIFSKIYDGTHTELDYVIYKQVKRFSITPFKKDKERKKLMRQEKKKLSKNSSESEVSSSHLDIFKGKEGCSANSILGALKEDIDEEIIDIDGELKGTTPFVCEMLPKAIRVIV